MVERYRNHLIFVKAEQDSTTALWKATTHIQFNEDPVTFRDVWLPRPAIGLRTKRSAEKLMMKEARKWVDERMRDTSQDAVKAPALDSNFLASGQNNAPAQPHEEKNDPPYPNNLPRTN